MSFERTALRFDCDDPDLLRKRLRISCFTASNDTQDIENAIWATGARRLTTDEWEAVTQNMIATPAAPKGTVIELSTLYENIAELH